MKINTKRIIVSFVVLMTSVISCDEKTPDGPENLFITSIWAGGTQILNSNGARGGAPVFINFSQPINKNTANTNTIAVYKKEVPINIEIEPYPESVVLKPVKYLLVNTRYRVEVNNSLLSKEGVPLQENYSVEFTTPEPNTIYFYKVVDSPTASESIVLKNNTAYEMVLYYWSIENTSKTKSFTIPFNTVIPAGQFITFSHETLSFDIDDENEELHLYEFSTRVDSWYN
jgi:hypothetical protein